MRIMLSAMTLGLSLCACQPAPKPAGDAGTQQSSVAATQAVIRGRATYLERIKMPPGADLVVQLIDHQRADTPQAVIASVQLDDVAGPPYQFALPYDPAKLRANGMYGLHASLRGPDGELWFVTDTRVPVTPGSNDVVEFRMVRVPGDGETASPATRSPWEEAKARGVAFRGVGNEPGWFVEVDQGSAPMLRATLDYGERTLEVAKATPLGSTPDFTGKTADGTTVVLRFQRKTCSDGMSDERYPASVELTVGEQRYRGCGRFLLE